MRRICRATRTEQLRRTRLGQTYVQEEVGADENAIGWKFPREHLGNDYELNWTLCRYPVIVKHQAYGNADERVLRMHSRSEVARVGDEKRVRVTLGAREDGQTKVAVLDEAEFGKLSQAARRALSDEDVVFVEDAAAGSGGAAVLRVRVVCADADVALAARALLPRAPPRGPKDLEDVAVFVVASLAGVDAPLVAVSPALRQAVVVGTRHPGDLAAAVREALAATWVERGCLPLYADVSHSAKDVRISDAAPASPLSGAVWTPDGVARMFDATLSSDPAPHAAIEFVSPKGKPTALTSLAALGNLSTSTLRLDAKSADALRKRVPGADRADPDTLSSLLSHIRA